MMVTSVINRWLLAATASAAVVVMGITQAAAQTRLPTGLAQGPTVGVESQTGSHPSVSGDGQFVVYAGPPAAQGDERASTIWLRDRSNGGEVELTQLQPGAKAGNSTLPVISGDGCYAVVLTEIPFDLFRDDNTGDRWDVYRTKLPACGGGAQRLGADLDQRLPRRRLGRGRRRRPPLRTQRLRIRIRHRLHPQAQRRPA